MLSHKKKAVILIVLALLLFIFRFFSGQLGDFLWLARGVFVELPIYATQQYANRLEDFFTLRSRPVFSTVKFPHGQTMPIEVVSDRAKQERGLSNRSEPQAMLFLFENHQKQHFWMKEMKFAIDIIWLDGNRIVGFEKNAQPENPPETFYTSPTLVNAVLELPAGSVENFSLSIGDALDMPLESK